MKEFILNDQSVNDKGFRVLTSGINLDRFLKNPVLLYNHDRSKGVGGKWENVRKDGDRLLGTPVFDADHEPGKTLGEQVAGGFLRAASIGIDDVEMEEIGGVVTAVRCTLIECSVVDIPANANAVSLYRNAEPLGAADVYRMGSRQAVKRLSHVLDLLGLQETASDNEITARVAYLKETDLIEAYGLISEAEVCGAITPKEREFYVNLATSFDPGKTVGMLKERIKLEKEKTARRVEELVSRAIWEGRITAMKRQRYTDIGIQIGVEALGAIFGDIPKPRRIIEELRRSPSDGLDRSQWTLDDWRKNDPARLQKDPILYEKLLAQYNKRFK